MLLQLPLIILFRKHKNRLKRKVLTTAKIAVKNIILDS